MWDPFGAAASLLGHPKSVRVFWEDLHHGNPPYLRQQTEYSEDGKESESWIYFSAQALSFHLRFEYPQPNSQVVIELGGQLHPELSRTRRTFNETGKLIEAVRTDFLSPNVSRIAVEYDDSGRVARSVTTFDGKPELAFSSEFTYLDHKTIQRFYRCGGETLSQTESEDAATPRIDAFDATGNWVKKTFFSAPADGAAPKEVRIVQRIITYY